MVAFVKLPDVPVMVSATVPVAATLLTTSVKVLVPVVVAGLNVAVTPLGNPDTAKLTLPVKPKRSVTVIVLAPVAPCGIVRAFGEAESLKFGGPVTISAIVVVFDKFPQLPAIVTTTGPKSAVELAANVRVLVFAAGFGLNVALTPLGRPEATKLTLLLKPLCGLTVIVLLPLVP